MASLEMIIKAMFEGSEEVEKAKTAVGDIGAAATEQTKPVEDLDTSLGDAIERAGFVVVAIAGVIEAFGQLYDAAKEAAAVDLLDVKLENLSGLIGTTSTALVSDLGSAAQGISNKLQITTGAVQALSTGLVTSEEGLLRMATASGQAGMTFDSFVSLVGNASENKLRAAGFEVDNFSGQVKKLMNDEDMTKGAAEFEVAMRAIESTVTKTGNYADTAAGKTQQLGAAFENVGLSAKSGLVPLAENVFPVITGALNNMTNVDRFNALDKAMTEYGYDVSNLTESHEYLFGTFTKVDAGLVRQMESVVDWTNATVGGFVAQGMSLDEAKVKTVDLYNSVGALDALPLDAKELPVDSDELAAAQALLDILNDVDLKDKNMNVDVSVTGAGANLVTGGGGGGIGPGQQWQAVGGPVTAGQAYNWQEYGYRGEVFVPSANGFVLSRADAERALAKALYGGESAIDPEVIARAVASAVSSATGGKNSGNVYNLIMPTSSNPADVRTAFELMEAWA